MLKVTGSEDTMVCQDGELFSELRGVINGAVHRVQAIWDKNSTTEDWGFFLIYANNTFNEMNQIINSLYSPLFIAIQRSLCL